MMGEREFLEFASGIFGVSPDSISLETTYASIPEWDSMAQLRLVMEISTRYGVEIPFADVTNVKSLWEFFRRLNGLSPKKVLAVDLDNTLWEGVIGEDGADGIRPNVELLKTLKALKDRGVLLVILSKNNEEEGLGGLEGLEGLAKEDFVTWRIDWNEKVENLKSIAAELNLGTDAFVFVDDNPAERLKMKALLPEVAVTGFLPNLAAYFPEGNVTEEDRRKTEEYKAEAERKALREKLLLGEPHREYAVSPRSDFSPQRLAEALGLWVEVHEMKEGEAARVAQLSQKANQFNVCTNRLSEEDVHRWAEEGLVVTCQAGDDFGDQGLVAFAVCEISDGAACVMDWVMSCRVAGRGVEDRFEESLEAILRKRNVRCLTATWRNSKKNAPVRELFDCLGFERTGTSDAERHYRKAL